MCHQNTKGLLVICAGGSSGDKGASLLWLMLCLPAGGLPGWEGRVGGSCLEETQVLYEGKNWTFRGKFNEVCIQADLNNMHLT